MSNSMFYPAAISIALGLFAGRTYSQRAMIKLIRLKSFVLAFLASSVTAALATGFDWQGTLLFSLFGSAFLLPLVYRTWRLKSLIPRQWQTYMRSSKMEQEMVRLPDRNGWKRHTTVEPAVYGNWQGEWSLVYPDGLAITYDQFGNIKKFEFSDGRIFNSK